jgi:hypothetical protein
MVLTKKPLKSFNNMVNLFKLISYNKKDIAHLLIGSSTYENIAHPSDVDMFEVVVEERKPEIFKKIVIKRLKNIFRTIKKRNKKSMYFIDFSAGDKNWTLDELLSKQFNESIFNEKSYFKLEVAHYDHESGKITPVSIVYEFYAYTTGLNQSKTTLDSIETLNYDIKKLRSQKNKMKMYKRMFTKAIVQDDKDMIDKLLILFNSEYGKLYRIISNIKTCSKILELYKKPKDIKRVSRFLYSIKQEILDFKIITLNKVQHKLIDSVIRTRNKIEKLNKLAQSLQKTLDIKMKKYRI